MYKDPISEQQYGDGAVKVASRLMLQCQGKQGTLDMTLALGIILSPDALFTKQIDGHELWECEVILIPKRKFRSEKTYGWLAEDMLTTALGDPSIWKQFPIRQYPGGAE